MPDDKKRREFLKDAEASAIGWMFPIAMALGFGIGYGLDKLFHTWPWLTAIFSAFGVAAAFINLFRIGGGTDGS
ncbi:MAG TPA: AtpZ/AtpI family protein [Thermoanaerobaculia bacterium]|jgi:F0F1-type ATP synthase assembly protein I